MESNVPAAKKARRTCKTVGVVTCKEGACAGYTLISIVRTTYLIDNNGSIMHSWPSKRDTFSAYLRASGNLLRDGNELALAPQFSAGGAAGYIEEVTWENELVWSWCATPRFRYLTHHDLELLPNGNVLVLCWEKKSKDEALAAGRHPELVPDGEVWNNQVIELQPYHLTGNDPKLRHTAIEAHRWSQWDYLVQDYDPKKANYVADVSKHANKIDINYCPPGGKPGCRNAGLGAGDHEASGLAVFASKGATGERDWLHVNCVSYTKCGDKGFVILSYNVMSEVVVLSWPPDDRGILYRFGNPLVQRIGGRFDQQLFVQHSAKFISSAKDDCLRFIVFNNGCAPTRMWSSVEEYELNLTEATFEQVWEYGPPCGHFGSFYSHHSSGVRRCPDGKNTLITQGPQGITFEITPDGEEVWRFINPVERKALPHACGVVPQGIHRGTGKFGYFFAERYPSNHCRQFESMVPGSPVEEHTPRACV